MEMRNFASPLNQARKDKCTRMRLVQNWRKVLNRRKYFMINKTVIDYIC